MARSRRTAEYVCTYKALQIPARASFHTRRYHKQILSGLPIVNRHIIRPPLKLNRHSSTLV